MNRILSLIKNHLPATMLVLYILSFWILPQDWNEDNALDGSWRYALGKFRGLGLSLGKDSWFTYGPLAHWFGAPMGTEQFQPFPYYVFGLFIAVHHRHIFLRGFLLPSIFHIASGLFLY